jgi:hypothetical protein
LLSIYIKILLNPDYIYTCIYHPVNIVYLD